MGFMKEVYFILDIHLPNTEVFCNVFKYYKICTAVVDSNKLSPGIKHIAIKYHHLRSFAQNNITRICYTDTR